METVPKECSRNAELYCREVGYPLGARFVLDFFLLFWSGRVSGLLCAILQVVLFERTG